MDSAAQVFVAGSAHLDVLARITGDGLTIDKIGEVSIEIGGTACNIAVNLASLGVRSRLMTAMQQGSPYTSIITAHLQSSGVEAHVLRSENLPAAVFSAHIGADGEMLSGVSSMPVETMDFPEDQVREFMSGSRCAILECNLSEKTLLLMVAIANELGIPVFVAAVSEEKSLRMVCLAGKISAVFMNYREAVYLGKRMVATQSLAVISRKLGCPIVVTMGGNGVSVVDRDDEVRIDPPTIGEGVQTLGAGDALLSASVRHLVVGNVDLVAAVSMAVSFAADVISHTNCNAGCGKAVERALIDLDRLATKDALTQLPNRACGEAALNYANDHKDNYFIMMIDIDHFKKVNDTFGHDVGDIAIRAVADVLQRLLRGDDLPCRWGGEEFLCLLKVPNEGVAVRIAERIRTEIEGTVIPVAGNITVSIGLSAGCVSGVRQAIKAADTALYSAKQQGRNRVVLYRPSGSSTAFQGRGLDGLAAVASCDTSNE